jgi:signal transduction histidine kinase
MQTLLFDTDDAIVVGPAALKGTRWGGPNADQEVVSPPSPVNGTAQASGWRSHVATLADGERALVGYATPVSGDALQALGWRVAVYEPLQEAEQSGRILQGRIAAVLLVLGALAAICGGLFVRRLMRGLEAIARSADAIHAGTAETIAVPPGRDEAARLGRVLDELLGSLRRERAALQMLNAELDQRVAARTREIERLAEQDRYAAVVRERLKMARDLHDTLAHSMMAMLAEVRLLKRFAGTQPEALAEELVRAEEAARQGVKEVRDAIAQMRFNPVRDAGLAAALSDFVKAFVERTGIVAAFETNVPAGAFADDRAEVLFRIAEEAMHNVERHSAASCVNVTLHCTADGRGLDMAIADDGIGFDPHATRPGHFGLAGLREQAQLIGAKLAIRSGPEHGTTIRVAWRPGTDG